MTVRSSVIDAVVILLAAPAWIIIGGVILAGLGFGTILEKCVLAPVILCGTTAAIHRLLRNFQNAWPLSALIAGYGLVAALFAIAAWAAAA